MKQIPGKIEIYGLLALSSVAITGLVPVFPLTSVSPSTRFSAGPSCWYSPIPIPQELGRASSWAVPKLHSNDKNYKTSRSSLKKIRLNILRS